MVSKSVFRGVISYTNPERDLHNPHGPARKYPDGAVSYYQNGRWHNIVGPCYKGIDVIRYMVYGRKIGSTQ